MRILVIIPKTLGDCVISTSFIRELKKNYLLSKIFLLTKEKYFGVFENNPYIYKIFPYKGKIFFLYPFLLGSYDIIFDLRSTAPTAFITKFTKSRQKIGFDLRIRKFAYTKRIKPKVPYHIHHLQLLKEINLQINDWRFDLFPKQENYKKVYNFIKDLPRRRCVFLTGGSWSAKRWRKEYFLEVMKELDKKGYFIILPIENKQNSLFFQEDIENIKILINWSYLDLFCLFSCVDFCISNDTGLRFLALEAGCKVLTIFGPTSPYFANPPFKNSHYIYKKIDCSPCKKKNCKDNKCLGMIKPKDVIKKLQECILK